MTPDVNVILLNLPGTIDGYTMENADASYTIVINSRLNHERQLKAYQHELCHIHGGDYDKKSSVDLIEGYVHTNV